MKVVYVFLCVHARMCEIITSYFILIFVMFFKSNLRISPEPWWSFNHIFDGSTLTSLLITRQLPYIDILLNIEW